MGVSHLAKDGEPLWLMGVLQTVAEEDGGSPGQRTQQEPVEDAKGGFVGWFVGCGEGG